MQPARKSTNLALNTESSINVFLKSSIGPKTRKVNNELMENVLAKVEATKASDVEQSDKINANPIMKRWEATSSCPIPTMSERGTKA